MINYAVELGCSTELSLHRPMLPSITLDRSVLVEIYMAQSILVKNKEIRVKNSQIVIEDEQRAELIEFTIYSANSIEGVMNMAFYVQYRNKLGEVGMDILNNAYPSEIVHNDLLVLDWLPSATFSKERGAVEIQIIGFTQSLEPSEDETYQSGKMYFTESGDFIAVYPSTSTHSPKVGDEITGTVYENDFTTIDHRWSTEKVSLVLPENIYENGTPIYTEAQVKAIITQLNDQILLARDWACKENAKVDSTEYSAKYYAQEAGAHSTDAEAQALLAKKWATYTTGKVDGSEWSAKHYAQEAGQSAQTVSEHATAIDLIGNNIDNINAVAEVAGDLGDVIENLEDINTVADNIGSVVEVSEVKDDVTAVAGVKDYLDDVAGIASDIADVASIKSDVSAVADIKTKVGTVADNISDVGTVADSIEDIGAVADDLETIGAVADDLDNIDSASTYAQLAQDWAESDDVIGEDGHSAKYWAGETEREVADIVKHDDDSSLISATTPINADQLDGHHESYFAVKTESGATVELSLDSDYVLTANLKNKSGAVISTASVDLPSEYAVIAITYNPTTKKLIFQYQGGMFTEVSIASLVDNLVTESAFNEHVNNTGIHVTEQDKSTWYDHIANTTVHISSDERTGWNAHVADTDVHVTAGEHQGYNAHVADTDIHVTAVEHTGYNAHVADTDIHVTTSNKSAWNAKYDKPSGGIPSTDMTSAVQTSLGKADSAYQKPQGGIPKTDLANTVQTSLSYADNSITYTDTVIA